jgi:hypothetical protein
MIPTAARSRRWHTGRRRLTLMTRWQRIGREEPKYSIRDMTEERLVLFNL